MINAIINGIFGLILLIANALTTPIFLLVSSIIPDFTTIFSSIADFIIQSLQYIPFIIDLLMIPRFAIILFFDFLVLYATFQIGYRLILTIYNAYKNFKL